MRILAVVRDAGAGRRAVVAGTACLLAAWLAEAADTGVVWDERGRRDPFEYAAAEEPAPVRKDDDNGGDPPDPPPPAPDLAAEAARFVAESLARLESRRHAAVRDEAATLMAKLRRAGLEGTGGYERLARVCETAGRLARRAELERYLEAKPIEVRGIVWDERNPVALIDDAIVREGDAIGDVVVESIGRDGIVIRKDDVRVRRKP